MSFPGSGATPLLRHTFFMARLGTTSLCYPFTAETPPRDLTWSVLQSPLLSTFKHKVYAWPTQGTCT